MVRIVIAISFLAGLILISACASQKKQRMLSFFFDGVPEAAHTGPEPGGDSTMVDNGQMPDSLGGPGPQPSIRVHYPYLENECFICHDANAVGNLTEPEPGLCFQCHEDYRDAYEFLHGPVAGGYCTDCHHPHRSEMEKLLKRPGTALCNYCHNQASSFNYAVHEGLEGISCTECHNPHGGSDKTFMR
jgi:predicted CXXCH cytochrome family protein